MKPYILAVTLAVVPLAAFAQSHDASSGAGSRPRSAEVDPLATQPGQEVRFSLGSYTYAEPGDQGITISGTKFEAAYTGTAVLGRRAHWFLQADVRGVVGNVAYNGWCGPWIITPSVNSPNGYLLDIGDYSPCSESGDRDWYLEGRALFGKDLISRAVAVSPYTGVGLRHISNGTAGLPGYRTDEYLYVPVGLNVRLHGGGRSVLGFNLEYDRLMHGWQKTRDSEFGSGLLPATSTTPQFSIDGFSDVSFSQHTGWAVRASMTYQINHHWSLNPYYLYWNIDPSTPNSETIGFTVNGISAQEQLGFYEPHNTTKEFGVRLGFHF